MCTISTKTNKHCLNRNFTINCGCLLLQIFITRDGDISSVVFQQLLYRLQYPKCRYTLDDFLSESLRYFVGDEISDMLDPKTSCRISSASVWQWPIIYRDSFARQPMRSEIESTRKTTTTTTNGRVSSVCWSVCWSSVWWAMIRTDLGPTKNRRLPDKKNRLVCGGLKSIAFCVTPVITHLRD